MNESITLSEARKMQAILGELESSLPDDLTAQHLGELIAKADDEVVALKKLRSQTAALVDEKRDTLKQLNEFMKRVRFGTKSAFGDDSLEYERVGGTRSSEHKRRGRTVDEGVGA
ncbi:MAG: hypothetical protein JXR76_17655 [Deltaproteobacteria bacterium]|nr:hypothetical protein [Deltaproteobacteria bacterium]